MLASLKDRITRIEKAAGLEVILLPDNRYHLLLTLLSFTKGKIVLEKSVELRDGDLKQLTKHLDVNIPLYLVINGRGVLHKKIQDAGTATTQLIQSVLPNAKPQEFYTQHIDSEKSSLVSIVRREVVNPILEQIQKLGYYSIGISLGGQIVSSLVPVLTSNQKLPVIRWAGHELVLDETETIVEYKSESTDTNEETYFQVDTEKIKSDFLISYAAAFAVVLNQDTITPFVETVIKEKEEFLNKQLFKKASVAVLGAFFFVLMVNFILFSSFLSKNTELSQKESKYSSMFSEMENLSKQVQEKEAFLSSAGWLESSAMTYYADRIASTVPASVLLTELSINPIDSRKSKEEKKECFSTGLIVVKGDCTKPTELNEWLEKIKTIDKIAKAKLVHYTFDRKENKGSFGIEIETEN